VTYECRPLPETALKSDRSLSHMKVMPYVYSFDIRIVSDHW
jgi:hypothetical protein